MVKGVYFWSAGVRGVPAKVSSVDGGGTFAASDAGQGSHRHPVQISQYAIKICQLIRELQNESLSLWNSVALQNVNVHARVDTKDVSRFYAEPARNAFGRPRPRLGNRTRGNFGNPLPNEPNSAETRHGTSSLPSSSQTVKKFTFMFWFLESSTVLGPLNQSYGVKSFPVFLETWQRQDIFRDKVPFVLSLSLLLTRMKWRRAGVRQRGQRQAMKNVFVRVCLHVDVDDVDFMLMEWRNLFFDKSNSSKALRQWAKVSKNVE